MIILKINYYPFSQEMKVLLATDELLIEQETLWFTYRSGNLERVITPDPCSLSDEQINTLRFMLMDKIIRICHNREQDVAAMQEKIDKYFTTPLVSEESTK